MPKTTNHPKLRRHVKKGRNGQVWTSWWYDMRGTGKPDIPLGNKYEVALAAWDEIHHMRPRIAGTLEQAFRAWETDALPKYTSDETKKGYARDLKMMRAFFGPQTWESVTLPMLKGYLKARTAKTRGNRELSLLSVIWNYARGEGLTALVWPAHGMERSKWKNEEFAREVEVSDEAFDAIHARADGILKDAMDIASATGLRIRDVLKLQLTDVRKGFLSVKAGKTTKRISFDLSASTVLPPLLEKRKEAKALHLKVLTTPTGGMVTERMLRDRFAIARAEAAKEVPECADLILRDMRKRAAGLAEDVAAASKLLQHSSEAVTRKHYRQGDKVRPVR